MPQQRIYELIARKLSGEATQAELEELQTYLQENGGDQYLFEILSSYWQQAPTCNRKQELMKKKDSNASWMLLPHQQYPL
ncbi:hypothetical protein [Paraflavitalea speifideaquila]|uniref:hypothetical protein n=1 Tax=Paraflavitalea speifideaquila TaxID=3076558 RepID=UPI0028E91950|nr:hypothetical protein [Paraflavitalea speifideiaquila]